MAPTVFESATPLTASLTFGPPRSTGTPFSSFWTLTTSAFTLAALAVAPTGLEMAIIRDFLCYQIRHMILDLQGRCSSDAAPQDNATKQAPTHHRARGFSKAVTPRQAVGSPFPVGRLFGPSCG